MTRVRFYRATWFGDEPSESPWLGRVPRILVESREAGGVIVAGLESVRRGVATYFGVAYDRGEIPAPLETALMAMAGTASVPGPSEGRRW